VKRALAKRARTVEATIKAKKSMKIDPKRTCWSKLTVPTHIIFLVDSVNRDV
jgi:hypothetical protein